MKYSVSALEIDFQEEERPWSGMREMTFEPVVIRAIRFGALLVVREEESGLRCS